ncbi:MAG: hypothetical protein ACK559_16080 [bacterium]
MGNHRRLDATALRKQRFGMQIFMRYKQAGRGTWVNDPNIGQRQRGLNRRLGQGKGFPGQSSRCKPAAGVECDVVRGSQIGFAGRLQSCHPAP